MNCVPVGEVLAEIAREHYKCQVSDIFVKYGDQPDVLDVVRMCALATATEVTILDPVCVVLGGGVTQMPGFPMEYFIRNVSKKTCEHRSQGLPLGSSLRHQMQKQG